MVEAESGDTGLLERSPEAQQVVDNAIDLLLEASIESTAATTADGKPDYGAIVKQETPREGLRNAAILLAVELDRTQRGIDRVVSFFTEKAVSQSQKASGWFDLDLLITAHDAALTYGISQDVGEKLVALEVYADFPGHAAKIATRILGRYLRDDEILSMTDRYTHAASRGSGDRAYYIRFATDQQASPETIDAIKRAFDEMSDRWGPAPGEHGPIVR